MARSNTCHGRNKVAGNSRLVIEPLRIVLKKETRALHDRLDAAAGHAAHGDYGGYTAFLSAQYAARAPIERWASAAVPADLAPPPTARLIAEDLAELGAPVPVELDFTLPDGADPLGLAWAIGGSSLGNKAMLVQRRRAGLDTAQRFLADPATASYFRTLLPRLGQPVSVERAKPAIAAAEAVFETFLAATARHGLRAVT